MLLAKFLFYYLQSNKELLLGIKNEGGVPAVNKADLVKLTLPVPSMSEQSRIVSILDKFDALINDISIGLPAERQARRSQYEYYRGKLLTFNEYVN
jgi:type I restriction enzyme S subunit